MLSPIDPLSPCRRIDTLHKHDEMQRHLLGNSARRDCDRLNQLTSHLNFWKEWKMNKQTLLRLSVIVLTTFGAIATASAQTPAPNDAANVQNQVASSGPTTQAAGDQRVAASTARSAAENPAEATSSVQHAQKGEETQPCNGPVSFCTIYF
jgi:uncharacterized membrane protein YccC